MRYPPRYTEVASKGRSMLAAQHGISLMANGCHPTCRGFAPEHMRAFGKPATDESTAAIILARCWSPKQDGTCRRLADSTSPNPQNLKFSPAGRGCCGLVWHHGQSLLRRLTLRDLLMLLLINCRPRTHPWG